MEIIFKILAVILAGVAAYFLWQGNADRAFVTAVFGAVSFFLSVRVQVRGRLKVREAEREEEWEEEEKRRRGEEEIEEEREKGRKGEGEIEEEEIDDENSDSEVRQLNEIPAKEQTGSEQRTTNDGLKGQRITNDEQL